MGFLTEAEGETLNRARMILNDLQHRARERYVKDYTNAENAWDMGRIEQSTSQAEGHVFDVLNCCSAYLSDEIAKKYAVYVGRTSDMNGKD